MLHLKVSTDDVINTTNNETSFPELRRFFEEAFKIKFQEGYVLKYLNLRILQSPLDLSVDQNINIMELVNEWFPTEIFIKLDTTFRTKFTHEKELTTELPLT